MRKATHKFDRHKLNKRTQVSRYYKSTAKCPVFTTADPDLWAHPFLLWVTAYLLLEQAGEALRITSCCQMRRERCYMAGEQTYPREACGGWVCRSHRQLWIASWLNFLRLILSLICCDICLSFSWRALQQQHLFKDTTLEAQSKCVPTINKRMHTHIPQVAKQQHNRAIQSKQTPFKKQKSNAEIRQIRCKTTIRQP